MSQLLNQSVHFPYEAIGQEVPVCGVRCEEKACSLQVGIEPLFEPWKQRLRIRSVDFLPQVRILELESIQTLGMIIDDMVVRIRRVAAVKNMTGFCKVLNNLQHVLTTCYRRVEIKASCLIHESLMLLISLR